MIANVHISFRNTYGFSRIGIDDGLCSLVRFDHFAAYRQKWYSRVNVCLAQISHTKDLPNSNPLPPGAPSHTHPLCPHTQHKSPLHTHASLKMVPKSSHTCYKVPPLPFKSPVPPNVFTPCSNLFTQPFSPAYNPIDLSFSIPISSLHPVFKC